MVRTTSTPPLSVTVPLNSSEQHPDHSGIPHSEYVYVILTAVTSGLSIVGGSCICALFVAFKDMRTPVRQLLLFLAISDTLLASGNFLGVVWYVYRDSDVINRSKGFCVFQSALTIYFSSTSFFWTVTMAISLFATVVRGKTSFTATYMKLFHILAWLPPGILIIIALGLDVLGTDTSLSEPSWCWIDTRVKHVLLWQFAAVKLWEIIAYVTTVGLYASVKISLGRQALKSKKLLQRKRKSGADVIVDASRKLTFVPLVFIVCRIWGTLRFMLGNFDKEHRDEPYVTWINPLQGVGDSVQGFANFIIYCYSLRRVRQRVARYLCPKWFNEEPKTEAETHTNNMDMKKSKVGIMKTESGEQAGTSGGNSDMPSGKTAEIFRAEARTIKVIETTEGNDVRGVGTTKSNDTQYNNGTTENRNNEHAGMTESSKAHSEQTTGTNDNQFNGATEANDTQFNGTIEVSGTQFDENIGASSTQCDGAAETNITECAGTMESNDNERVGIPGDCDTECVGMTKTNSIASPRFGTTEILST